MNIVKDILGNEIHPGDTILRAVHSSFEKRKVVKVCEKSIKVEKDKYETIYGEPYKYIPYFISLNSNRCGNIVKINENETRY